MTDAMFKPTTDRLSNTIPHDAVTTVTMTMVTVVSTVAERIATAMKTVTTDTVHVSTVGITPTASDVMGNLIIKDQG